MVQNNVPGILSPSSALSPSASLPPQSPSAPLPVAPPLPLRCLPLGTMHDTSQSTLNDTHLFTRLPSSLLGHRCLARRANKLRSRPCYGWLCRTWGIWGGMLSRHPLALRLMPHVYALAMPVMRQFRQELRGAQDARHATCYVPFRPLSPLLLPSPASRPVFAPFLPRLPCLLVLIRGRSIAICGALAPSSFPRLALASPLCSGCVPPPAHSLFARTMQSSVRGIPVPSVRSPSLLLPLGSPAPLPPPYPALFARDTLQGTIHAVCKHVARHAPWPPALFLAPNCTCCQRSITLRLPTAAAPAGVAAVGGRSICRGGRGLGRPRLPPGHGFNVHPAAPGSRRGSIRKSYKSRKICVCVCLCVCVCVYVCVVCQARHCCAISQYEHPGCLQQSRLKQVLHADRL